LITYDFSPSTGEFIVHSYFVVVVVVAFLFVRLFAKIQQDEKR
jgi:hypothetical protein